MINPDATLATSRVLPFTPAEIFGAFKDPEKLARWWGPNGFTNTFESFDFKEGGRWKFVMHGPNGANYDNEILFREIVADEKVVVEHVDEPHFILTITFVPTDGGTLVSWDQEFDNPEVAAKVKAIAGPGNEQNLDRWTEVLGANK